MVEMHVGDAQRVLANQVYGRKPGSPLWLPSGTIIGDLVAISAPNSSYATMDVRDVASDGTTPAFPLNVLDFDTTVIEYTYFEGFLSPEYPGRGVRLCGQVLFSSATANSAVLRAAFYRIASGGDDVDSAPTFDFNSSGAIAANAASGVATDFTIDFDDGADMDSVGAGEAFVLCLQRKIDDANDTAAGDLELRTKLYLVTR